MDNEELDVRLPDLELVNSVVVEHGTTTVVVVT